MPAGESLADLRRAFVPIWLLDRYQVEAAAKSVGGVNFPYALNGENAVAQRRARHRRNGQRFTRCSTRFRPPS